MKRTVRIGGTLTGVIATGSYENFRPGFTWEETIEDCNLTDEQITERIQELYDKCDIIFNQTESKAIVERIRRERRDMRFIFCPELNKDVPSTTSVINWDADFFVSAQDLAQYASQGNITHQKVWQYIERGEWKQAKDLPEIWADIVIVSKGDLKLSLEVGDFPSFLKKYPIKDMKNGERAFNIELETCGLADFTGIPEFKDAEKVKTVFDVKRTPDKHKNGMQLADYCKQLGCTQGVIIPLNDKSDQNYSKPIVYDEKTLNGYYEMLKQKRKDFRTRYGL